MDEQHCGRHQHHYQNRMNMHDKTRLHTFKYTTAPPSHPSCFRAVAAARVHFPLQQPDHHHYTTIPPPTTSDHHQRTQESRHAHKRVEKSQRNATYSLCPRSTRSPKPRLSSFSLAHFWARSCSAPLSHTERFCCFRLVVVVVRC